MPKRRLTVATALVTAAALGLGFHSPAALALEPAVAPVQPGNVAALIAGEANSALPNRLSVVVVDNSTGQVLHARQAAAAMTPASTMKLVTAAVALQTFGPNHNFQTRAFWDPAISTVYLVGGGDPALGRHHLERLAAKLPPLLAEAGPLKVVADSTLFPEFTEPAGWLETYVPNEVRPASALMLGDSRSLDAAKEATKYFVDQLKALGLTARYSGRGPATGTEIAKVAGQTLAATVRSMLTHSDNTIAEMLFRLSAASTGQSPTWEASRAYALGVLGQIGVDTSGVRLIDGSGLSRADRLTATMLASLLQRATEPTNPRLNALLDLDLLAVGGKTGTLENRFKTFKTRCAKGRVEAKTGTLRDVASLAGYVETKDGGRAVFAIIANRVPSRAQLPNVRKAIDLMVAGLAGC